LGGLFGPTPHYTPYSSTTKLSRCTILLIRPQRPEHLRDPARSATRGSFLSILRRVIAQPAGRTPAPLGVRQSHHVAPCRSWPLTCTTPIGSKLFPFDSTAAPRPRASGDQPARAVRGRGCSRASASRPGTAPPCGQGTVCPTGSAAKNAGPRMSGTAAVGHDMDRLGPDACHPAGPLAAFAAHTAGAEDAAPSPRPNPVTVRSMGRHRWSRASRSGRRSGRRRITGRPRW